MSTTADRAFQLLVESVPAVVVIDVETCPSPDGDHIISIAAVTCRNGSSRSTWSTLLDPGVPITNSHHHGLTDADVAGVRAFADIVDELDHLLEEPGTILVAHNASFDVGRLHLEHQRLGTGEALRDVAVLDTMRLPDVIEFPMPSRSRTLAALCSTFDIVNVRPHDAASDATATADVLHALLRAAAARSWINLKALHKKAGGLTTRGIGLPKTTERVTAASRPELPVEHLATHTTLLGAAATAAELDAWVAGAIECVELRCYLLADKAAVSIEHAGPLHERLTEVLIRKGSSLEPGQGGTLAGALNILAPQALRAGPGRAARWWQKHQSKLKALARCDLDMGACPECVAGCPCPLDIAHQPLVVSAVYDQDGTVSPARRKRLAWDSHGLLRNWAKAGVLDMAGYGAWLGCDIWLSEGNQARSDPVLEGAMRNEAYDPRILRLYAQRLASQQRHDEVAALMVNHLPARTTDDGWRELDDWYLRYSGQRARRQAPPRAAGSPRVVRPTGRARPNRFTP